MYPRPRMALFLIESHSCNCGEPYLGATALDVPSSSTQLIFRSDFVYMVPPFLATYGVTTRNRTLLEESYNQIKLYRTTCATHKQECGDTYYLGRTRSILRTTRAFGVQVGTNLFVDHLYCASRADFSDREWMGRCRYVARVDDTAAVRVRQHIHQRAKRSIGLGIRDSHCDLPSPGACAAYIHAWRILTLTYL